MKALNFLNSFPVTYAGILEVIHRNTYELYEDEEDGICIRDTISEILFVACDDSDRAYAWYEKHARDSYELAAVWDESVKDRIVKEHGLELMMTVHQYAYMQETAPAYEQTLNIEHASVQDIPFIMAHYDRLEEWEIRKIIEMGNLYIGYDGNTPIGMIGCHLEGSMGLLEVLPEYRRKGYALQLESFLIERLLKTGHLCFGQVETGNDASVSLQEKLGLSVDERIQYWLISA